MERYFFHLCDHSDSVLDEHGTDLPPDEVPAYALRSAREIIADDALEGRVNMGYSIEVRNAESRTIHILDFKDAVEIVGLD